MADGDKRLGNGVASGELAMTGSLMSVKTGFRPAVIKLWNRSRNTQAVWNASMPADSMQLTVDSGAGTTDVSFVTSNAITAFPQSFTIGTTASINTNTDVLYWEAHGNSNVYGV